MKRLRALVLLSTLFTSSLLPLSRPEAWPAGRAGVSAQEDADEELIDTDRIVVRVYVPRYVGTRDLYHVIRDLRGRTVLVPTDAGHRGFPNLSTMDDAILVRDEIEATAEILALLEDLDRSLGESLGRGASSAELRTLEFSPRYISLESAATATTPFQRMVRDPKAGRNAFSVPNCTVVPERNVIILRDEPEQVAQMLELLTRLDVPEQQVRLRVWVAIGDPEDPTNAGLPADLVEDLSRLLPGFGFRGDGLSMVQTSVAAGRSVELDIEGEEQDYSLLLHPTAFDPKKGRLTLGLFQFVRRLRRLPLGTEGETGAPQFNRVLFSTSAVLNAGDYTVLGASGHAPIFVVMQVEPLGLGSPQAR